MANWGQFMLMGLQCPLEINGGISRVERERERERKKEREKERKS